MMTRNRIIASIAAAGILVGGGTAAALAVSSSATKPASSHWASLTACCLQRPHRRRLRGRARLSGLRRR